MLPYINESYIMFIIYNHTFKESSIVDSQQQMFNLAVANLQLILRISSCESTLRLMSKWWQKLLCVNAP